MSKHLESFRNLESLQVKALDGMQNQGVEGLADLLARHQAVAMDIARQKEELKPYLDQWEALGAEDRKRLREGRAGEILTELETVAQAIQVRHQSMFGEPAGAGSAAPGSNTGVTPGGAAKKTDAATPAEGGDLSQKINLYRGLQ